MGFWGLSLAGAGFICIGIWQAFSTAKIYLAGSSSPLQSSSIYRKRPYYTAEHAFIAVLATLFIANGIVTAIQGFENGDHLGIAIQLEKSGKNADFSIKMQNGTEQREEVMTSSAFSILACTEMVQTHAQLYDLTNGSVLHPSSNQSFLWKLLEKMAVNISSGQYIHRSFNQNSPPSSF